MAPLPQQGTRTRRSELGQQVGYRLKLSLSRCMVVSLGTGRHHGMTHYPMLVPGSGDYGTTNIQATHQRRQLSIKVYPRLVHVLNQFNSRLQGSIFNTLQGI